MRVIKKLGHRETYDINKIKNALQRTAKAIDVKFLNSDWKELKPRIESRLEPVMRDKDEIYFWEIDDVVIDALLRSRFKEIAKEYIQTRSKIIKDKLNDLNLTPHAMWLLRSRYLKKDADGEPIETAREMMCRVATAVANVEKTEELREEYTKRFTDVLCNLDFLPNSPCLVSAGTNKKGTWLACYGLIPDDSIDGIFDVAKVIAKIFQMGGGAGASISLIRELGAFIKTSHGTSSGPVAFLKLYNVVVDIIKAGGFRRGAMLTLMDYNRPDIEDFIHCKRDVKELENMNISVMLDDDFFNALDNDEDIPLISPLTNEPIDSLPASLILEIIANNMWSTGEPGVLFYNAINNANPTPHLGEIRVCNPCFDGNEKILTINGYRKFKELDGKRVKIIGSDGRKYFAKIKKSGRKNIINLLLYYQANEKEYVRKIIKCTPEHIFLTQDGESVEAKDLVGKVLIEYETGKEYVVGGLQDNGDTVDVYDFIMKKHHWGIVSGFIAHNCAEATLLKNEGCCLGSINLIRHISNGDIDWDKLAETTKLGIRFLDNVLEGSLYPSKLIEDTVKRTRKVGLGIMGFADLLIKLKIKYSSQEAIEMAGKIMSFINDVANQASTELGKEKGLYPAYQDGYRKRRNAIVTTIAPTGSLALIAGVSWGVEPNIAGTYTREIDKKQFTIVHPFKDDENFETTYQIPLEQHLNILVEFQKHVENSISKTVNCPENTSVDKIKELIINAHRLGIKGITVYRENCDREPMMRCEDCKIE